MFLQSLSIKPTHLIAPEDVTTIFYKMDEFYTIHKTFVSELEAKVKNWSDDQQIAEAVKKLVGNLVVTVIVLGYSRNVRCSHVNNEYNMGWLSVFYVYFFYLCDYIP